MDLYAFYVIMIPTRST